MYSEIPGSIKMALREWREGLEIKGFRHASGGCINNGGTVESPGGNFFIKWNDAGKFPGMFAAEMLGLELLRTANTLRVPEPLHTDVAGAHSFLVMEQIDSSRRKSNFFDKMGLGLADLHRNSAGKFGLDHSNYIGSLPQDNGQMVTWTEFFIERRLEPQLQMARDSGRMNRDISTKFRQLYTRLENLIPAEAPALLHGDLWSGNYMVDDKGEPCLIDPAVYYGHREMDLAMTTLFGGFDREFFIAYQESFPTEQGLDDRIDLYNLYPLLVHVNLFGGGYLAQVLSILKRFV